MSGKRARQFRRKAQQAVNRNQRKLVMGIFAQPFSARLDDAASVLAGNGSKRSRERRLTVAAIAAVWAWACFAAGLAIGTVIW